MKFKTRLLGNIQFVGELFRRRLLQESIIISVFDMLLAVETKDTQLSFINDNTVEGAVVLMEKIGHMIDEKLSTESTKQGKKLTEGDSGVKDKIVNTFARFDELVQDQSVP